MTTNHKKIVQSNGNNNNNNDTNSNNHSPGNKKITMSAKPIPGNKPYAVANAAADIPIFLRSKCFDAKFEMTTPRAALRRILRIPTTG